MIIISNHYNDYPLSQYNKEIKYKIKLSNVI